MCDDAHTLLTGASDRGQEPTRAAPTEPISRKFARLARRDTAPEVKLRRELHRRGLRYRVDQRIPGLPRKRVDVVFTRRRIAVFVDGCFWHGCPEHFKPPKTNAEWWHWKIGGNRARDSATDRALESLGWHVIRVWEHEDPAQASERVFAEWEVRGH